MTVFRETVRWLSVRVVELESVFDNNASDDSFSVLPHLFRVSRHVLLLSLQPAFARLNLIDLRSITKLETDIAPSNRAGWIVLQSWIKVKVLVYVTPH